MVYKTCTFAFPGYLSVCVKSSTDAYYSFAQIELVNRVEC